MPVSSLITAAMLESQPLVQRLRAADQDELAYRLGIKTKRLSKLLTGRRMFSVSEVYMAAHYVAADPLAFIADLFECAAEQFQGTDS